MIANVVQHNGGTVVLFQCGQFDVAHVEKHFDAKFTMSGDVESDPSGAIRDSQISGHFAIEADFYHDGVVQYGDLSRHQEW